jgi:signal transduction histidine kinase
MKPQLTTLFTFLLIPLFLQADNKKWAIIQHVIVNGMPYVIDSSNKVKLSALEDDLIIEFNKSNKGDSTASFQYILQGYDKKWKNTGYKMTRYTNLKGGQYVFDVFENSDTTIHDKLTITVEATLAEEAWFVPSLLLYGLLLVGAITYFWNIYNLRQKLKLQTIRNHIAADLHDEVGATLSSIGISIRTIQRRLGEKDSIVAENLERMKLATDETNRNLRDTVWSINPDNDSFEKVFERMSNFAYQILQDQDILCTIDNQVDMTKPFKISMEQRQNVYLIFKEAVNNIAKHSEATKATITMKREKHGILLTLEDNGKGFDVAENYEGNGLKNYRRRAAESFIEFDIKSTPSVGTVIMMLIPEL